MIRIVANWKMNPVSLGQALKLVGGYRQSHESSLVVCPPAEFLSTLSSHFGSKMSFGAQDCFWESAGAYTGESSPKTLVSLGAKYVILGHSERRKYLGEDDAMVNKKLSAALAAGLSPILCLGGGLAGRVPQAAVKSVLRRQLNGALKGLKSWRKLVLVFEPAYAISTFAGRRVGAGEVADLVGFLRKLIGDRFGSRAAAATPVLYGGSVDGSSFASYLTSGQLDGFLVGGASLKPSEFNRILRGV